MSPAAVQLVDLEAQQVDLARPLPLVATELGQLRVDGGQRLPRRLERREVDRAEAVERLPLHGGGEQRLVVVLTVQVDQPAAQLGQRAGRRQAPSM